MPALDTVLGEELAERERQHRRRALISSERLAGARVLREGEALLSFSCNDYLGLSQHPEVKRAACRAVERYGTGAGASRLVTGNAPLYAELEAELAALHAAEAALVFSSGYVTNLSALAALAGKGDLVVMDRLAHASLVDGVRLSGAAWKRFRHNDAADCARLLAAARGRYRRCLVVTETVFSMEGSAAPLAELSELALRHGAWLFADDAHGSFYPLPFPAPDVLTGTLSKALGAAGGYVCGSRTLVDYLITAARGLVYSTGLPPAVLASALAALRVMRREPERCALPLSNARMFCTLLGLPEPRSAIVPLVLGTEERALAAARRLEEEGFLVAAIRPPTVPPGTARLRFAFSAAHRQEEIARLAAAVRTAIDENA
jgi:8-amino-7-oxononanoate synthase